MKKIFHFALLFAAAGMMSLGFSSCSSDDNDNDNEVQTFEVKASTLKNIVAQYVNDVINPTYNDLQSSAATLDEACKSLYAKRLAGTLTQTDIDYACTAFKTARKYWEQSEAFLYGAASNDNIDPHIDSWPLDQTQLAEALTSASVIAGITGSEPAKYVYTSNGDFDSTMGFHGLEFILFRNGANRTLAALNSEYEAGDGLNENGDNWKNNQAKLKTVKITEELAFAAAVAGDLHNMTTLLAYEWSADATLKTYLTQSAAWVLEGTRYNGQTNKGVSYSEAVKTVDQTTSMFVSWPENLKNIFEGGCSNICTEVHTQKLGQAYRKAIGKDEGDDAADYIESPYSKNSFQDYQDNIYSIKNSLYGMRGTETVSTPAAGSIMAFLNGKYQNYDALNNALNNAISALESAKKSGIAFIDDPGNAQVNTCITAIEALDKQLKEAGTWCSKYIIVK
jgi:hypothetical protein